jgi:sec-independent protein translocase protein TatB
MIGIVALIFLGPRKIPEMARKAGKLMAEFRSTTQDFKSTWEREVNLEEETKTFDIDVLEKEAAAEGEQTKLLQAESVENTIAAPEIKSVDKERFDRMVAEAGTNNLEAEENGEPVEEADVLSDKRTWL